MASDASSPATHALWPDDGHAAASLPAQPFAATASAEIDIRPLRSAEFGMCVDLQRETWGQAYDEIVPASLLKVAQRVGGCSLGAFRDDGTLDGFVFGITGVEHGRLVHWSHMLAVRAGTRDRGVGLRLKQAQRDVLRLHGVGLIYWTFDPLVARNAHLNINRLDVEIVEYVPDMYGTSESSLHRGVGTDRFVVAWHVGDQLALDPRPPVDTAAAHAPVANPDCGTPGGAGTLDPLPALPLLRVAVPSRIERVQAESLPAAARWRQCTRRAFQHYLGHGYRVAGFLRGDEASHAHYILAAPAGCGSHSPAPQVP